MDEPSRTFGNSGPGGLVPAAHLPAPRSGLQRAFDRWDEHRHACDECTPTTPSCDEGQKRWDDFNAVKGQQT